MTDRFSGDGLDAAGFEELANYREPDDDAPEYGVCDELAQALLAFGSIAIDEVTGAYVVQGSGNCGNEAQIWHTCV